MRDSILLTDTVIEQDAVVDRCILDKETFVGAGAHFINVEFNKSDLRDDAKAALDAKIPILVANSGVTIRISGHADERGSTEYNLALGTRRAATAKRYLVERGVADARIETTSFGEERPVCTENAEPCWGRNRRDEFEITMGGPTLSKPKS